MSNVRVRIGVKLPWPLMNAATAVVYVSEDQLSRIIGAVEIIKRATPGTWTSRLFVERA